MCQSRPSVHNTVLRLSTLASVISTVSFLSLTSYAQEEVVEEVLVTGVRKSLQDSLNIKRDATQIVDAITAEDIGKLPDNNLAEALQRVTGIQIQRNATGAGESFQIRGLTDNRVEINGRAIATANSGGSGQANPGGGEFGAPPGRGNTLDATASGLIKNVTVIKSPSADLTEGSIGGMVKMETFRPLDFKSQYTSHISVEGIDNELADDTGHELKGLLAGRWNVGEGEFGAMLNINTGTDVTTTDLWTHNYQPLKPNQINNQGNAALDISNIQGYSVFRPTRADIDRAKNTTDSQAINLVLQFQPNADMEFTAEYITMEHKRERDRKKFTAFTNRDFQRLTSYQVENVSWSANSNQFYTKNMDGSFSPYSGDLRRGILSQAEFQVPLATMAAGGINANDNLQEATGEREFRPDWQDVMGINFKWDINEKLTMEADLAVSETRFNRTNQFTTFWPQFFTNSAVNYMGTALNAGTEVFYGVAFDHTKGTDLPDYSFNYQPINEIIAVEGRSPVQLNAGGDLVDSNAMSWGQIGGRVDDRKGEETQFQLDFDYDVEVGGITSVEFGFRWSEYKLDRKRKRIAAEDLARTTRGRVWSNWGNNSTLSADWLNTDADPGNDVTRSQNQQGDFLNSDDPTLVQFANELFAEPGEDILFHGFSGGIVRQWPVVTKFDLDFWLNTLDTYFPGRGTWPLGTDPTDATTQSADYVAGWMWLEEIWFNFDLTEETTAAYGKINFEYDIGVPVTGNFGIRYVQTDFKGNGMETDPSKGTIFYPYTGVNPISASQSYDNILPSLNLTFELREDLLLRAALAQTMARPAPVDLVPTSTSNSDGTEITRGNPDLSPLESDQMDLAIEWYVNADTSVSATYFKKKLKNFLDSSSFEENFGGKDVTITLSENGESGNVDGLEFSYQQAFTQLPNGFDGLGLLLNYTLTDSDQSSGLNQWSGGNLPVNSLSEKSYNIILFWEKWGWSFRAAYNWRDDFYRQNTGSRADAQGLYVVDAKATAAKGSTQYSALSARLPQWENSKGQLDLSASYQFENGLTVFAHARDFNGDPLTRSAAYAGSPYITYSNFAGTTYRLGLKMKFQ